MNQSVNNDARLRVWYSIARGTALAAIVIALAASVIIISNYVQLKKTDPLNSASLIQLKENLKQTPQDELLKNDVRALQLLTRKAYFTGNWQIQTGGYLIIISLIILTICLKIIKAVRRKLPAPENLPSIDSYLNQSAGIQYSILSGGGLFMFLAIILAFMTETNIQNHGGSDNSGDISEELVLQEFWYSFRGPDSNGISSYETVDMHWDGTGNENVLWKTEIPVHGYSSPIIAAGKLFVTGGNRDERKVYCLDSITGEILWNRVVRNMVRPEDEFNFDWVDANTGFAAPTMATDGKRVVAIFATGDMACYRLNGDLLWTMNVGAPDNHYAHSSSLLVEGNLCFVQLDHHREPKLLALDMSNGEVVWQVERKVISWASPICVYTGSRRELILADSKNVSSYNPATGELYWEEKCLSGEVGPSPSYSDGIIFVANEYSKASAIKINQINPENPSEIIWQTTDNLPNTASPISAFGLVLLASSRGIATMLDGRTGEAKWEHNFGKGFYSSPILTGDKIYLTDLNGKTYIFRMSAEFELLAENELGESVSCTPVLFSDRIYFRGNKHIFCISELDKQ